MGKCTQQPIFIYQKNAIYAIGGKFGECTDKIK